MRGARRRLFRAIAKKLTGLYLLRPMRRALFRSQHVHWHLGKIRIGQVLVAIRVRGRHGASDEIEVPP